MAGIKAKGYISSVHSFLFETLSNKTASLQQDISINDLNAYAELIDQKYPILQSFLPQVKDVASIAKGQINSVADYANVIVQILNQQVNFYLWKRAGWIIGGWLLLLLIMLYEKRSPYANGGYGTSTSTSTQMRF
ncbi:hypothetical protein LJC39_00215 [Parabacteroides sp. OttesenSCG-928-B22]|nr:hypothetical protein [Parabacteroides sp. OttesenSCG-928-B22]